MERDAQVRACLNTKRLSVLSETALVRPGDDSAAAASAAALVGKQLAAIPGGIAGIVTGCLDALVMGYAVGELVYDNAGNLASLRWHDPRRFAAVAGPDFDMEGVELLDGDPLLFPSSRFLWYTYQGRYGNPYGESDLVAAYRDFSEKETIRRMWLTGLDRFAVPTPVASVPLSWSQGQVDDLAKKLGTLQSETALVVPDPVKIGFDLNSGRVEPAKAYVTAIEYHDTQIARGILGQDMTTQGNTGSLASAVVQQDVLTDWVQGLRSDIAGAVSSQVCGRLCELLCGPGVAAPVLSFPNLSGVELAVRRELISAMVTGAVVAPGEGWIRDYLGLPEKPAAGLFPEASTGVNS